MNLQEQISRIQSMMGLINEDNYPAFIRRRVNIKDEQVLNELKKNILYNLSQKDIDALINNSIRAEAYIIWDSANYDTTEDISKNLYAEIVKVLKNKFHQELVDYYNEMRKNPDDDGVYCFIKHSERYGGLQSRGFTECVYGWYKFLGQYGKWFGDLDWNEVKQKMDEKPNEDILIKKPLENHIYHYYFSVRKTTR